MRHALGTLGTWLPCLPVLAFVYVLRMVSHHELVIDWDETVYFYVARDWVAGGLPYVTAWDIKGPGMYAVFVPVFAAFGFDIHALRVFTSLYHLATLALVYRLALRESGPAVAWLAPLVFGVMFASPDYLGLASNGELIVMLPACASILLLLRSRDPATARPAAWLAAAGALAGLGFLMKHTSVFTSFAPACVWLVLGLRDAATRPKTLRAAALYAGGFVGIVLATAAYFAAAGGGREFLETMLRVDSQRARMLGFGEALRRYLEYNLESLRHDPITACALAAAAFVGIVGARDRSPAARERRLRVLVLLALTQVAIVTLQFMFPHYFLQNALPFALVLAVALGRVERPRARRMLAAALAVLCVGLALARDPRPLRAESWSAGEPPPTAEEQVARWVRERTRPTDTIYVVGAEPVIYLLAERYSPTRYFFYLELAPLWERALGHTAATLAEIERARPRYIVLGGIRGDPDQYGMASLLRFIEEHYEREATVAGHTLFRPKPSRERGGPGARP